MSATGGKSGGGRGGRTRLALLLSLWWVNSKSPYDSSRRAELRRGHRTEQIIATELSVERGGLGRDPAVTSVGAVTDLGDRAGVGDFAEHGEGSVGL